MVISTFLIEEQEGIAHFTCTCGHTWKKERERDRETGRQAETETVARAHRENKKVPQP